MKKLRWMLAGVAVLALAAAALAASYSWQGQGLDNCWDTCKNWVVTGSYVCWPSDSTDDVAFPKAGSPWDVELIEHSNDDMTIAGDIDFTACDGTPTLTVDSVTIDGDGSAVVVTISGATIETY